MYSSVFSSLLFRLVSTLIFLPAVIYTFINFLKHHNTRYLQQRLGRAYPKLQSCIHIHCASVGEINTCMPLLKLIRHNVTTPIVVTTNTITGYRVLTKQCINSVHCIFLPLDYGIFIQAFHRSVSPYCTIIMETELWPTLIHHCARRNIRLWLINGRISSRTLHAPRWMRNVYKNSLQQFESIVARSPADLRALKILGANESRCHTLPDLKYAWNINTLSPVATSPLGAEPYLLCVSTHSDEEIQISREWWENQQTLPRLVIAPRHPSRIHAICKAFDRERIPYYLHKSGCGNNNGIYLIDSVGELDPFLHHAQSIFIGGSLVPRGGHNVLEAARCKKCTLIGPHHQNFIDIVDALMGVEGIQLVENTQQLIEWFIYFSKHTEQRDQMAENAFSLAYQNRNAHHDYYTLMTRQKLV